ncbi:unnamed protein product [Clonostachys chloroleuca]|uniref:Uncharacterized protein n=1 Tax=Clonostachys chloroleuca TaxID=1926264 RepID=A0AA35LT08_9HYPO|nr:unnamed protein product [Clonostachys chloroleuca]
MPCTSSIEAQAQDITPKKGVTSLTHIPDPAHLAGLLYAGQSHIHARAHAHDDHEHIIINPIGDHGVDHSFPSTGIHTPLTEHDDEEAVLSDIASEDESDLEIPPTTPISERRHRNATSVSSDDFEFPIFLGRQDEEAVLSDMPSKRESMFEIPPSSPIRERRHRNATSVSSDDFEFPTFLGRQDETKVPRYAVHTIDAPVNKAVETKKSVDNSCPILAPKCHPVSLSGPMMSWWPSPVEAMDYGWIDERQQAACMEASLMQAWLRTPKDILDNEWSESFYE